MRTSCSRRHPVMQLRNFAAGGMFEQAGHYRVHEAATRRAQQLQRERKRDSLMLEITLPDTLRVFDKPVSQHASHRLDSVGDRLSL